MNHQFLYFKNIFVYALLFFVPNFLLAHEQWLLTQSEIDYAKQLPPPNIFIQVTWFNSGFVILGLIVISLWIYLNHCYPQRITISKAKVNLSVRVLTVTTGLTLLLCAFGLVPKVGVPFFQEPVFLASDLHLSELNKDWMWLQWAQVILGLIFLSQMLRVFSAIILSMLVILGVILFGKPMFQYIGFYSGIIFFILFYGLGKIKKFPIALLVLQIFTGINFIYSAISVKWLHPNMDIIMIQKHHAFTFGIPADYFVFLMFLTEFSFGLLIILGFRLRLISTLLLLLFIFMSINFSENFLSHCFVYGSLLVFIITNGIPLNYLSSKSFKPIFVK